jgi:hypothetical protein
MPSVTRFLRIISQDRSSSMDRLTLNIRDTLVENLLEGLGVLKLLLDLGDDGLGELTLLLRLDLALVADPRFQDGLRLVCDGSLLLQLVRLGFELGGFLLTRQFQSS